MKKIGLFLGPGLFVLVFALLSLQQADSAVIWTAAITCLTATWWITEAIPIPAASLIPIAILPLVGVLNPNDVAEAYGSPLILLLLGGFILSTAMEKSGAHRRLALNMVRLFGGGGGRGLVFGFMAASAILSMWISNTATVLMLLPIVLAILEKSDNPQLKTSLLLGIAYAASVGGLGTPIGTTPNLIFMRVYTETTGIELTFTDWMTYALPVVILLVPIIGLWLTRKLGKAEALELPQVGQWRQEEIRTLLIFSITALAWITRKEPFGGWSEWLGLTTANDASVALSAVVIMFLVPNGKGGRLLDWKTASTIPWGILLLFAGGITIAKAFNSSGISASLGDYLSGLQHLPILLVIACLCLVVTFLTEITSNTATTALLMPILAAAAVSSSTDPKLLMIPAALTASCAFMLPAATGPNAVVFSSNRLSIQQMAKEGLILNFIGATIVSAVCYLLIV